MQTNHPLQTTHSDSPRFPARTLFANWNDEEIKMQCERAGINAKTVLRWIRQDTHFNVWKADSVAVRFGKHPVSVWGEQWLGD